MPVRKIQLKNFTVFEKLDMEFSDGINVFIGENGVGKTHIMKLLYSAGQSVKHDISFSQKIVRVFKPDDSSIRRLISRKNKGETAQIKVYSDETSISASFTTQTKKWEAKVVKESEWERQNTSMESIYIPAKEILSNSRNLTEASLKGNVDFDDTYVDIIAAAKIDISSGKDTSERKKYLDVLQKINNGKVTVEDEKFYLKPGSQAKIEFNLVAEGIRKIALLWQLIKNGVLEKGSILFWDEPEANINPVHIPVIVEMLYMLQKDGVQVFVSTHDYFLAKYIDLSNKQNGAVRFFSLYKNESNSVDFEKSDSFTDLEHNTIMDTFMKLYHREIGLED